MCLDQASSGTAKNAALIHLHLATGQIGKPGSGPFSLTGQHNAMGGREAGGMANLLPGHRDQANAAHRSEEHTSELQSLMRISDAGFCLKKKKEQYQTKKNIKSNKPMTHRQYNKY